MQNRLPKGVKGAQVGTVTNQSATCGNPLFQLAITDKVTADAFDMHPEDVVPFFPVEDALLGNFQVFGDLPQGDRFWD
ncbi:hypothetical protein MiSe_18900 [Microseira wollei NIES-4236]|uniref:Uncharacterized protein n=1 Tax=Microseira wollei NIES-4236 TaxID=2530354 RepID=A0AAV3XCL3_9CYAN|nr:hypothetical protein MiSe_18900 [Microseira wollei NIES-4236]